MTADPISNADFGHLWLEHCRRQLGRPRMTEDEFERLGHQAVADIQPQLIPDDDDPAF